MESEHDGDGAAPVRVGAMAVGHYHAYPVVDLPDRRWPGRRIDRPPRWCSVDLRDGNQALIEPMGPEAKRALWDGLVEIGFREIEVGFPAASQIELDFVRALIEQDAIPHDVTIQVLTQSRPDLIRNTLDSIEGARRAIVHLYNSTSELQRRVVFQRNRAGVVEIALDGVKRIRERAEAMTDTEIVLEYSPESFTGTELDFALEICEAVADVWEPTAASPMIINLPATVEMSTPNVYADQIESFARQLRHRDRVVLSVHPHNDRGTAVAAAEMALMAGADRVEGTLFGNGERTGNVDIVTLALNMFSQGVDPGLDFRDINRWVRLAEGCTQLSVHPRHPYAGELVFTAFSGSHQDAIKKGLAAVEGAQGGPWEVPYLPINPAHLGRSYDALIRVNSQSGKAGVSYLLERTLGARLPRRMQIEFQGVVQRAVEHSGSEVSGPEIATMFEAEYLKDKGPLRVLEEHTEISSGRHAACRTGALIEFDGQARQVEGQGNGPIDAFFDALVGGLSLALRLSDFSEHALGSGADAQAMAYVEVSDGAGRAWYGAGRDDHIVRACLQAAVSAINRATLARRAEAGELG